MRRIGTLCGSIEEIKAFDSFSSGCLMRKQIWNSDACTKRKV